MLLSRCQMRSVTPIGTSRCCGFDSDCPISEFHKFIQSQVQLFKHVSGCQADQDMLLSVTYFQQMHSSCHCGKTLNHVNTMTFVNKKGQFSRRFGQVGYSNNRYVITHHRSCLIPVTRVINRMCLPIEGLPLFQRLHMLEDIIMSSR